MVGPLPAFSMQNVSQATAACGHHHAQYDLEKTLREPLAGDSGVTARFSRRCSGSYSGIAAFCFGSPSGVPQ